MSQTHVKMHSTQHWYSKQVVGQYPEMDEYSWWWLYLVVILMHIDDKGFKSPQKSVL